MHFQSGKKNHFETCTFLFPLIAFHVNSISFEFHIERLLTAFICMLLLVRSERAYEPHNWIESVLACCVALFHFVAGRVKKTRNFLFRCIQQGRLKLILCHIITSVELIFFVILKSILACACFVVLFSTHHYRQRASRRVTSYL